MILQESCSLKTQENYETECWGCGLRLLLPSYAPVFKCGWCGAITNNMSKQHRQHWFDACIAFQDRLFVPTVLCIILSIICMFSRVMMTQASYCMLVSFGLYLLFAIILQAFNISMQVVLNMFSCLVLQFEYVICSQLLKCAGSMFGSSFLLTSPNFYLTAGGGVWAVYPVVFSVISLSSVFHSISTFILASGTLVNFCLASFTPAGQPPKIRWGNYGVVVKGGLNDYTFCQFCEKPKSAQTHHCHSCRTCVLDMDHHCPFVSLLLYLR